MNVTEAYNPGHPEKGVMVVLGRVMMDRERWSGGVPWRPRPCKACNHTVGHGIISEAKAG